MVASQATEAGSIPVPCSKSKSTPPGVLLLLGMIWGIEPTFIRVSGGHPAHGGWTPWAPYALLRKAAIDSRTLLQNRPVGAQIRDNR